MKKWMYVISVSVMTAIFLVMYFSESHRVAERERKQHAAEVERAQLEAAKKAADEAKAREDAQRRTAEREAVEAKKEADRVARYQEESRKIQEATDKYTAEANASSKKAAELEIQLSATRAAKEKLNRETFELAKQVERGKVDRRTAEMEIQRTVEIISRKAKDSALTRMPATAPAPAS